MSIWICIGMIAACAVCWDVGVVWQKQAADHLPRLQVGHQLLATLRAFLTSRKWIGGLVLSAAGWGLFAFALSFTPVSLARSIQGSGFVLLAVFSILFLDHRLSVLEWTGVLVVTLG